MTFDTVYKVNPPLRSSGDVEAIKQGLADGTIDAIATDHAPHSALEKDTEFEFAANGMIGLESAVPLILGLDSRGCLSPLEAIAKVTCNPAGILGAPLGDLGTRDAGRSDDHRSRRELCPGLHHVSLEESQLSLSRAEPCKDVSS